MSIPFYRLVEYKDDGHYIYQCLHCGGYVDIGHPYFAFEPRYCCFCGVEYKGFILPKKIDWINAVKTDVLAFQLQEGHDWSDSGEIEWRNYGSPQKDPFREFKFMQEMRKQAEEEEKEKSKEPFFTKTYYKIVPVKKTEYHSSINIDVDEFYRKTGKKFNRNNFKRVS